MSRGETSQGTYGGGVGRTPGGRGGYNARALGRVGYVRERARILSSLCLCVLGASSAPGSGSHRLRTCLIVQSCTYTTSKLGGLRNCATFLSTARTASDTVTVSWIVNGCACFGRQPYLLAEGRRPKCTNLHPLAAQPPPTCYATPTL